VDISWLGHACIRVRTQQVNVIMDPVDKDAGFDMGRPTADIVTISNSSPSHSNLRGLRGEPLVLEGPGEYEVGGVQLWGHAAKLKAAEGSIAERNTVFVVEAEELRVAHLGGLGTPLNAAQEEEIGSVDVLIVPIGGGEVLDAAQAARIVRELEPKIVIPMHYQPKQGEELEAFVKAVGLEAPAPEARLTVQRRGLGDTVRLAILEPRGG